MSSPDNVYSQLVHILATRHDHILEFEILPRGTGPLLQDGCSIGISKEALVQSFVIAREIFFNLRSRETSTEPIQNDSGEKDIASQIILLFDCEHLTAANHRKRSLEITLQSHNFTTASHAAHESLVQRLESELTLLTTFLTSRLHRHTKSPTLWTHRLWTMNRVLRVQGLDPTEKIMGDVDTPEDNLRACRPSLETIRELFVAEMDVVLGAGEIHPRNYYAFSYARELMGLFAGFSGDGDGGLECLAMSVVTSVLEWCLAHPRDISGWMFVLFLLEVVHNQSFRIDAIKRTVRFALDVGWEGESLWTFVDMAARSFGVVRSVQDMIRSQPGAISDPSMSEISLEGTEKPWMVWVARVRAYWAAGGL